MFARPPAASVMSPPDCNVCAVRSVPASRFRVFPALAVSRLIDVADCIAMSPARAESPEIIAASSVNDPSASSMSKEAACSPHSHMLPISAESRGIWMSPIACSQTSPALLPPVSEATSTTKGASPVPMSFSASRNVDPPWRAWRLTTAPLLVMLPPEVMSMALPWVAPPITLPSTMSPLLDKVACWPALT